MTVEVVPVGVIHDGAQEKSATPHNPMANVINMNLIVTGPVTIQLMSNTITVRSPAMNEHTAKDQTKRRQYRGVTLYKGQPSAFIIYQVDHALAPQVVLPSPAGYQDRKYLGLTDDL